MRYTDGVKVEVLFIQQGEEKLTCHTLTFRGNVDRKRVYRMVRRYIRNTIGREPKEWWVRKLCRYFPIVPTYASEDTIEAWIKRIECNEDEGQPDSSSEAGTPSSTEIPMQAVSDKSSEGSH